MDRHPRACWFAAIPGAQKAKDVEDGLNNTAAPPLNMQPGEPNNGILAGPGCRSDPNCSLGPMFCANLIPQCPHDQYPVLSTVPAGQCKHKFCQVQDQSAVPMEFGFEKLLKGLVKPIQPSMKFSCPNDLQEGFGPPGASERAMERAYRSQNNLLTISQ